MLAQEPDGVLSVTARHGYQFVEHPALVSLQGRLYRLLIVLSTSVLMAALISVTTSMPPWLG